MEIVDTGSGIPIVLLHAATGHSAMWEHQFPAFTAAGYRCIAFDRSAVDFASDQVEEVAAKLKLDRFHLVGTAAGAIIAIDYALTHAARLRSLVAANTIVGAQDADYLEISQRLRPSPQFEKMPADFRELGPSYRAANAAGTKRWNELAQAKPRVSYTVKNRIDYAALGTIRVPTLLLTGDGDVYMPPPVLRMFAKCFPRCDSAVLPECGHSGYWEQPEAFNRAVLAFLAKN
ncbi:MAG TPA: alpha/beta hydrolase [Burkholderiales bacterium]|jgi:pimeloyl-ACP methyl ester carboxylesterase|nr:alpha/beta hydrolase [Burkholderiales bacterium]